MNRLVRQPTGLPNKFNEFDTVEHTETDNLGNKKLLFTKRVDGLIFTCHG